MSISPEADHPAEGQTPDMPVTESRDVGHRHVDVPQLPVIVPEASGGDLGSAATPRPPLSVRLAEVNKELWLVMSLLALAAVMNFVVTGHRMLLGLYVLPTLFSAYHYGKRHAVLSAFASLFIIGLLAYLNPHWLSDASAGGISPGRWYSLAAWGGILVLTGYSMGTLHDRHKARVEELRETYHGILLLLRQFVSKDKYTENHCYRVSVYAATIGTYLGLSPERIDDVRAASMLHDIGKLELSRRLIYKAARLTEEEYQQVHSHVGRGADILGSASASLRRIIPIILAHHDRFDGSGYRPTSGEEIPLEARIIAVADVYDAMTSDRPYRKAQSPFDARSVILKGSGTDFDPRVVGAFIRAFKNGEMEVPAVVL